MVRLNAKTILPLGVSIPQYNPQNQGVGIVHLGPGAFHRSHQAFYTDQAIEARGGNWRIIGVGLRSDKAARELNPQDGLYTLLQKDESGTNPRVIASIAHVLSAPKNQASILKALAAPETRIVSLTITEKGYGLDRTSGGVDTSNDAIVADLSTPETPVSAIGYIVRGLQLRQQKKIPPFTILCCDNLPDNGRMLRHACADFARYSDSKMADRIENDVAFPSTMVDRITPAQSDAIVQETEKIINCSDHATIATEPFHQWIIEDNFPLGRPMWEEAGALFVNNVRPYEDMKMRMLNGTHSLLAYCGFPAGFDLVREAIGFPALRVLAWRHLHAAANTLVQPRGIDLVQYAEQLLTRFSNPAIDHRTYQIAMDGTEKLPQRIFTPAMWALENGQNIRPFAFVTAAWINYWQGKRENGQTYSLRDPREKTIKQLLQGANTLADVISRTRNLREVFPNQLINNPVWQNAVLSCLTCISEIGLANAIEAEARHFPE